jgi:hypothetical protein
VAAGDREARIVGAVVDDDQLQIGVGLAEDRLDRIAQERRRVEDRQDDGDSWQGEPRRVRRCR